jgi:ankyrin repeat protein
VNQADYSEKSALDRATEAGHEAAVKLLIAHGASFNRKNWSGKRALHIAAENGDVSIVRLLLKRRGIY